jgi:molybdopterin-containing oxidoreductase family iron-sulfur binding subunit
VRAGRATSTWEAFGAAFSPDQLRRRVGAEGEGMALVLEPSSSPLVAELLTRLHGLYPKLRVFYYAPFSTGGAVIPQYDVGAADVILVVDADFLAAGPFHLRSARQFADRRRQPLDGMNRLYVAEPGFSVTGGSADHRRRCAPSALEPLLSAVLAKVSGSARPSPVPNDQSAPHAAWTDAVATDLRNHRGRSLVVAGERLPPRAHALAAAINDALGNTGRTVWYTASPLLGAGDGNTTLPSLIDALRGGGIDTLVCVGGNPSYASPAPLEFSQLMRRVPNSAYVGLYENETAADARWFVPAAHYLEAWGDARAYDGTLSVIQPLVQPLHGGRSLVEVLAVLAGASNTDPLTLLRECWRRIGAAPDEVAWESAVRRGVVPGTAAARIAAPNLITVRGEPSIVPRTREQLEVVFGADARVHDGSFANNAWLQELPDPVTKLTWDNAAHLSPETARQLHVETGDVLSVRSGAVVLHIPALVVPGHADDTLSLHCGYGRSGAEKIANGVGVDVYRLWPVVDAFVVNAFVERAADAAAHAMAITQTHWSMEGRDQARSETLAAYRANPGAPASRRRALTIYDPVTPVATAHQWAMTIDLGTCIGCSACVTACQAENNIPVVGREDVANSREMHWLRIDRYQQGEGEGSSDNLRIVTQPMLCQHCENAPCEYVCPVGATTHSDEGLNEMVYNRCVGTRFCSNNCPYKVRRFNWFDYNAHLTEIERMVKNPDVTVRERGVMEKCTFCVQRIREAEIAAEAAGQPLRGDQVKTACQQSCPTKAIVFGSLTEPESEVVRRREVGRTYGVLADLGTEPRVRYLARIRNVNPELETRG